MPVKHLTPVETQLVALAIQKRNAAQNAAQQLYNNADTAFAQDVALVSKAQGAPTDDQTPVNFHVENGVGSISWPDIAPAAPIAPDVPPIDQSEEVVA